MLFKFVSVCLIYLSYYIILSNMLCNMENNMNYSNEVILTYDIENTNNSINLINSINSIHDIDIENGLYNEENLDTLYKSVHNSKKNNLISIISNVSYMSYIFFKNMKEIVYKKVNYLYPSNIKIKN